MPVGTDGERGDDVSDDDIATKLVDALARPDGNPALRPVHAIGNGATGSFVASPAAEKYCIAEHFQAGTASLPVTVRFSNGSGSATRHDGWSDVRGMATRFHLADGTATDLVAMTLREFFAPDAESFLAFAIAAKPQPFKRESPWRKILDFLSLKLPIRDPYPGETIRPDEGAIRFADQNRSAQLAVFEAATIGAPTSDARAEYHAVHTFIVTGHDGTRRWVRFSWQPTVGVLNTDPLVTPTDVYLEHELRERLATQPAKFTLMMVVGETGDAFDDPTRPWPPHRRRILMGTLTLDAMLDDEICERLNFNPWLLTKGIEASDDPVLRVRREAYIVSGQRRGATPCPFAGSHDDGR